MAKNYYFLVFKLLSEYARMFIINIIVILNKEIQTNINKQSIFIRGRPNSDANEHLMNLYALLSCVELHIFIFRG